MANALYANLSKIHKNLKLIGYFPIFSNSDRNIHTHHEDYIFCSLKHKCAVQSPTRLPWFSGETCNCFHWKKKLPCKKHWKIISRKQQTLNTYKNPISFLPVFLCGISQRNGAYFIMKGVVLMWQRWRTFPSQLRDYTFKSTRLKTDCLT